MMFKQVSGYSRKYPPTYKRKVRNNFAPPGARKLFQIKMPVYEISSEQR